MNTVPFLTQFFGGALLMVGSVLVALQLRPRKVLSLLTSYGDTDSGELPPEENRRARRVIYVAAAGVVCLSIMFGVFVTVALLCVLAAIPFLRKTYRRHQLARRFLAQVPEVLEAMAALLTSGRTLPSAIHALGKTFPEPSNTVLRSVDAQVRVGVPIDQAIRTAGADFEVAEWELLASALRILQRSGGDLAPTIKRIAEVARRRQRLAERLRTWTSQGRLQGWVMSALPFVVLFLLTVLEPELMQSMFRHPLGWLLLSAAVVLQTVAVVWIRRILTLEF